MCVVVCHCGFNLIYRIFAETTSWAILPSEYLNMFTQFNFPLFFFSPAMPLGLQDLISQPGIEPGPQQ